MASLSEMVALGYGPEKSTIEKITGLLEDTQKKAAATAQKRQQDEMEQIKLYNAYREAGYSAEDSTEKTNRTYRSTGFIETFMNGERDTFQQPTEQDETALKTQKLKAEIGGLKATTRKSIASSKAIAEGRGPSGMRGNKEEWTPNQWQSYVAFLTDEDKNPDFGTPENDEELSFARNKLRESAGFETEQTQKLPDKQKRAVVSPYKVGQSVYSKSLKKNITITKINADGSVEY